MHRVDDDAARLRAQANRDIEDAVAAFRPNVLRTRLVMLAAIVIAIAGAVLAFALSPSAIGGAFMMVGVLVAIVAHLVAETDSKRQLGGMRQRTTQDVLASLNAQLIDLARDVSARNESELIHARAGYDKRTARARAAFDAEEDQRLEALAQLSAGNTGRMSDVLADALALELPLPCGATALVIDAQSVSIELDLPPRDALPTQEAKRLASGKVTYKAKPEKRLREQYSRLVAGMALRHAAEAMLHLPTCIRVDVQAMLSEIDPSTGDVARRCVLRVAYEYSALAPLTMDGLDPVAALGHFEHQSSLVARQRELAHA
jgi:hypothetical protein